ncbi:MAG: hypothetical protein Q7R79_01000 [bacterium]|nr:hypothetical protein [bacterium]
MRLSLEQSVFATITYFDHFSYPLTAMELWQNLLLPMKTTWSLSDVCTCLLNSALLHKSVEKKDGFFFLKGRSAIISLRLDRNVIADIKYKKARWFVRFISILPFIRLVCVCNSLGFNHAREESDIDFFIVAQKGSLWFVRFLTTGFAHILGQRPTSTHQKDRLCLSFYISDDSLDLSRLQLKEHNGFPDVYLPFWILYCVPLYDERHTFDAFMRENTWVCTLVPNAIFQMSEGRRMVRLTRAEHLFKHLCETTLSLVVPLLEESVKRLQLRLLPKRLKEASAKGDGGVLIEDTILKLHPIDRREEIRTHVWEQFRSNI